MSVPEIFRASEIWSCDQLRQFLRDRRPDEYTLIDVRQPEEYARRHLAGAILMPARQLLTRFRELPSDKTTIVYSGSGIRSRAAAMILYGVGFRHLVTVEGGIGAWRGELAEGMPGQVSVCFGSLASPGEFAAMAWLLEDGSRLFYLRAAEMFGGSGFGELFAELAQEEEKHKKTLVELYAVLVNVRAPEDFPKSVLRQMPQEPLMEGCFRLNEVLGWLDQRKGDDRKVLELALMVETSAYDRYLHLLRGITDDSTHRLIEIIAGEERRHLEKLCRVFDEVFRDEGVLPAKPEILYP